MVKKFAALLIVLGCIAGCSNSSALVSTFDNDTRVINAEGPLWPAFKDVLGELEGAGKISAAELAVILAHSGTIFFTATPSAVQTTGPQVDFEVRMEDNHYTLSVKDSEYEVHIDTPNIISTHNALATDNFVAVNLEITVRILKGGDQLLNETCGATARFTPRKGGTLTFVSED